MRNLSVFIVTLGVSGFGCKKDEANPQVTGAHAPKAEAVQWDPKAPNDAPDWPMNDEALTAAVQASFAKKAPGLAAGANAHLALWAQLKPYDTTYLKVWKNQLAADPGSAVQTVDAFLELALQVTGPGGFWRKTVPGQWLGCEANPETAPCLKMAAMTAELAQWDPLIDTLQKLEPAAAQKFVQKNLAKLNAYLTTYVPDAPNPEGMKKTPFFQKHLAAALEGHI